MPRGNGTGPIGGGGRGSGRGMGAGRGRNNGPSAAGPGGQCICPKCKEKVPHQQGKSCLEMKCPRCGNTMVRG